MVRRLFILSIPVLHVCNQPLSLHTRRSLLVNAAPPERLEWYMNVNIMRHRVPANAVALLGVGTSPNEAANATINTWLRDLCKVHAQTVDMQLRVCQLGALLSHNSAMYHPTLAQIRSCDLLACVVRSLEVPMSVWDAFESTIPVFPLESARERTCGLVRKRPAGHTVQSRAIERTAFTLRRVHE